jgi:two-component system, chemotaxis family, chemotaxis protein CheY
VTRTILAIDDSSTIRQMLAMTLGSAGHRVLQAENGLAGYTLATTEHIDAVITDLNMPVMDGLDFVRMYRTHPSSQGVPILLLSTESSDKAKREAKDAGATGWITKPFRQDQLLAVVERLVGA